MALLEGMPKFVLARLGLLEACLHGDCFTEPLEPKVAEVIQAFQSFPAKKSRGGFQMGSISNPCPRVPVCLNL